MNQDLSLLQLVLHASLVVQVIILLLLVFSVLSWSLIFSKLLFLRNKKNNIISFSGQFYTSKNLTEFYLELNKNQNNQKGLALVFINAINEYNKLKKQDSTSHEIMIQNIERNLISTIDQELESCTNHLDILATFASVGPYIGLLGTVWGIMHAFLGLGNQTQAVLSAVAPGIAEALVTTAIGLFVAIPAYIFYNQFTAQINKINLKFQAFADDLLNIISRRIIK